MRTRCPRMNRADKGVRQGPRAQSGRDNEGRQGRKEHAAPLSVRSERALIKRLVVLDSCWLTAPVGFPIINDRYRCLCSDRNYAQMPRR